MRQVLRPLQLLPPHSRRLHAGSTKAADSHTRTLKHCCYVAKPQATAATGLHPSCIAAAATWQWLAHVISLCPKRTACHSAWLILMQGHLAPGELQAVMQHPKASGQRELHHDVSRVGLLLLGAAVQYLVLRTLPSQARTCMVSLMCLLQRCCPVPTDLQGLHTGMQCVASPTCAARCPSGAAHPITSHVLSPLSLLSTTRSKDRYSKTTPAQCQKQQLQHACTVTIHSERIRRTHQNDRAGA